MDRPNCTPGGLQRSGSISGALLRWGVSSSGGGRGKRKKVCLPVPPTQIYNHPGCVTIPFDLHWRLWIQMPPGPGWCYKQARLARREMVDALCSLASSCRYTRAQLGWDTWWLERSFSPCCHQKYKPGVLSV